MLEKDNVAKPTISLRRLDLSRDFYGSGGGALTGTATFGTIKGDSRHEHGIEMKITLQPMHIAAIVTACGDALREEAMRQAQGFYHTSNEMLESLNKQLAAPTPEAS